MTKTRIIVVDDITLFRNALASVLTSQDDFEVIGVAADGNEAVFVTQELRPDVVLMDVRMMPLDGVAATRRLKAAESQSHILLMTSYNDDDNYIFEGVRAGAEGYILKDVQSEVLFEAIRTVARGGAVLEPPAIAAKVVKEFARIPPPPSPSETTNESDQKISQRDLSILRLIAKGYSNHDIANELGYSEGTVRQYVSTLLRKLDAQNRTHAALIAKQQGLI